MTREEERLVRYKQQRSKEAIDLAMQGRWQDAVDVNQEILSNFPRDVDAFNRLGRAYMELGQLVKATEAYSRTVEIDPYNAIANRNLRRIADMDQSEEDEVDTDHVAPHHFIEEIGKSGTVVLYDLAPKEKRARMVAGDNVVLKVDGSSLVVENKRGEYMGRVEPRTAQRLARLITGGNQYSATIVRAKADMMSVIIRETYQDPSQAGKLSFPPRGVDELRAYEAEVALKDDTPYEEDSEDESGYTIIGGDEIEVLSEDSDDSEDDTGNEDD
ncbi:MAG TPA: tetratricopeptide repeat protein [Dehalococcoidia bacterium]|nr:tetratricopeptide repeat protein [Dehalococcoidia bacterium]